MYYLRESMRMGMKSAKKVYYNGRVYNSLRQAAYYIGLSNCTLATRIKKGDLINGLPIYYVDESKNDEIVREIPEETSENKESERRPYARDGVFF